jgi:hypothetical protein
VGAACAARRRWGPVVFGKRLSDGTLPFANFVVLFPALLLMWLFWWLKHTLVQQWREDAYNKVSATIYLGRWPLFYPSQYPDNCPVRPACCALAATPGAPQSCVTVGSFGVPRLVLRRAERGGLDGRIPCSHVGDVRPYVRVPAVHGLRASASIRPGSSCTTSGVVERRRVHSLCECAAAIVHLSL